MAFTVNPYAATPVQAVSGTTVFKVVAINEAATQTFKVGTPVAVDGSGNIAAWGGANPSGLPVWAGFSTQFGQNLSVAGTASPLTYGSVAYQTSAVNIPPGAPLAFGQALFYSLTGNQTIFRILFGTTGANTTPAATDVGVYYGLTKDAGTGFWYCDKAKATQGTSTALQVVAIDPWDPTHSVWVIADAATVQATS
jgi:hypothetical protein